MLDKDSKILLTDDSRIVRTAIRRILGQLGYANIIEAEDGEEAFGKYQSEKPSLIFLDIVMPNMTGDAVLAKIRETDKTTPIIMLSSVAKQSQIDECKAMGANEFVIKPLTAETGPSILRAILERL